MKVENTVKVKKGITDPDTGLNIAGYVGRIKKHKAKDIVNIEWDSISLQSLPDDYIRSAIEDGCDYLTYNIGTNEIELCKARDTPTDVLKAARILSDKWHNLEVHGELAEIISEIEEEGWYSYLYDNLIFPFKAEVVDGSGGLKDGTIINVQGIEDEDDHYGIIIKGKIGRRTVHYTLAELEVVEGENKDNQGLVELYKEYFWNR